MHDGLAYRALSVQDPKYKVYRVTQDINPKSGASVKKGTKVLLVNGNPNKNGYIKIRPLEGEFSGRRYVVPPYMIEFLETVASLDSKGNPITVITLRIGKDEVPSK